MNTLTKYKTVLSTLFLVLLVVAGNASAAITIDTTAIMADIASVGATVISVVLAIAAFTIAINMFRKSRS